VKLALALIRAVLAPLALPLACFALLVITLVVTGPMSSDWFAVVVNVMAALWRGAGFMMLPALIAASIAWRNGRSLGWRSYTFLGVGAGLYGCVQVYMHSSWTGTTWLIGGPG
jgi:hypothetical protein